MVLSLKSEVRVETKLNLVTLHFTKLFIHLKRNGLMKLKPLDKKLKTINFDSYSKTMISKSNVT